MLPTLIVIGAQKAGTSSLHRYLRLHPEISMSTPKELNFFTSPRWNWAKGVEWYESHFAEPAPVRGESSPSYTTFPHETGIAERMHAVVPEASLIYLVRDPIDRMVSQYVHDRAIGKASRTIEQAFSGPGFEDSRYVIQGRYHMQLSQYLDRYALERILVISQEELLRRREPTLRRVFAFLAVDPSFSTREFAVMSNTSADKRAGGPLRGRVRRVMRSVAGPAASSIEATLARPRGPRLDPALRRRLAGYFADDAAALRRVTGQEFPSWTV